MNKTTIFLLLVSSSIMILACNNTPQPVKESDVPVVPPITEEHQSAFDALNELQTSSGEMQRIYSTFPGIHHPCYPADTSYMISQSDLQIFMEHFITKRYLNFSPEKQKEMAATSVLAQLEYKVLHCSYVIDNKMTLTENMMTGTWVIPNVLGKRDVIINW